MSAQKASHEAAAGAWAGLVGTVLGYPLDVVKSRMQTAHARVPIAGAANHATSASVRLGVPGRATFGATLGRLAREEGLRGAYKGLGPPVCMMMLMNSVNFTAFNRAKEALGVRGPVGFGVRHDQDAFGTAFIDWRVVAAAAAVGPPCALIGTPFELVKLQMQMENVRHGAGKNGAKSETRGGAWRFARRLHARYGWRVFYLGLGVNVARECLFNAIFFTTYEHTQFGFVRACAAREIPTSTAIATAGGLAGAAAWLGNLPLDCVKSGVQGQDLRRGGFANNRGRIGFAESARAVVRARGVFGFFSGAAPSISRSFIVSGSRFVAFSGAMRVLEGERGARAYANDAEGP